MGKGHKTMVLFAYRGLDNQATNPPRSGPVSGRKACGAGGALCWGPISMNWGGTEAVLTFPVDLTPFQMQKKQTSQTKRRQRARSHFSEPGLSIPEDKLSTLRLEANRTTGQWGPALGQREQRPGLQQAEVQTLAQVLHLHKLPILSRPWNPCWS